ncbi:MAG: adenylyltransferase/cytidyltransferase family protein [Candidatus Liptonbacteria bacterium]|nr:adenylyltransferase/cytidyltransferase family protein [Candidatus Liptonbacteria bacterium]
MPKQKTVLVFGTFDGLHPGHEHFLKRARKYGDRLVVAVGQDAAVQALKGHPPQNTLAVRIAALRASGLADRVIPADRFLGTWRSVARIRPDVIVLGYDQKFLGRALRQALPALPCQPKIISLRSAHHPGQYHSSLLGKRIHAPRPHTCPASRTVP